MTLPIAAASSAVDVLRLSAERVDGPLRTAVSQLPAALCAGAGFHFGFADAEGRPGAASPGKMVRPGFAFAASRVVNGGVVDDRVLPAAVAVELVHNFSLIHDDMMDRDRVRRGRPAIWVRFGVPYAVLLGDAMLSLANRVLAQGGGTAAALMTAELNSAVIELCTGQCSDMNFEQQLAVSPDEYLEMAAGKTASLLATSCVLGALAGGGSPNQVAALRGFGHHIGLAFQLVDDLLGIFGDPAVTGKPVGADLLRYKKSMPVLAALRSGTSAGEELAGLYRDQAVTKGRLSRAVALVEQAGGREWTQAEARRHHGLALDCLQQVGGHPRAVTEMTALAHFMIDRSS